MNLSEFLEMTSWILCSLALAAVIWMQLVNLIGRYGFAINPFTFIGTGIASAMIAPIATKPIITIILKIGDY